MLLGLFLEGYTHVIYALCIVQVFFLQTLHVIL